MLQSSESGDAAGGTKIEPDWDALVDAVGDLAYAVDLEGRFTYLNAGGAARLGHSADRLLGRHFSEIVAPEALEAAQAAFERMRTDPEQAMTVRTEVLRKDGTSVLLEDKPRGVWRDGRLVGIQGIARDVTVVARLQAENQEQAGRLVLLEERTRLAHALHDAVARVIFSTSVEGKSPAAFLADVRRALVADVTRRLGLSETDVMILRGITEGLSNGEIGKRVHLSADAVKDRIRRMMGRIGAHRRAELGAEAVRLGLV
jgi:PAS domain S-box-containing protein